MCGIAGVLDTSGAPPDERVLVAMADAMRHRGPDDAGSWISGSLGFAHRRLSIIDLSPAGHQPMFNETGDVALVHNGELYNYVELRGELEAVGHRFRSRTDSEVFIHAYEEWGEASLDRFNGHFAIGIWDGRHHRLLLARDRFGTHPLYYHWNGSRLLFGSEVKAILAHPGVSRGVNLEALNEYFTFQNVLSDLTLFAGVRLLPPATILNLDCEPGSVPVIRTYWDYRFPADPRPVDAEEAAEELYRLFKQAVTRQLMSDVPLGSYLSGGMDSGSITAVARQHLGRLRTFTGGFDLSSASGLELGFDERSQAEALANRLKTEHYEVVLHAGDMEQVMPELIWHLEDLRVGQCYPNYYVARLASRFVKVVLSGAGGDELFAGYPWRYYRGRRGEGLGAFHRNYYDFWQRLVPDEDKSRLFRPQVVKSLGSHSTFDVFRKVLEPLALPLERNADFVNASLYFELKTFLHGLLVVEDKLSFAHGMETRMPFLDNDLVDFALALPVEMKLRNIDRIGPRPDEDDVGRYQRGTTGDGKMILRAAMGRVVPQAVTERHKQGFSAPDASWFRGESIDYINGLLRDPSARINEYLNPSYVAETIEEHTSGRVNHRLFIWSLLSFEWWLRTFLDPEGHIT